MQNFYIVMAPGDVAGLQSGSDIPDSHALISLFRSAVPRQEMDDVTTAGPQTVGTFAEVANEWFSNNASRWARSYSLIHVFHRGKVICTR